MLEKLTANLPPRPGREVARVAVPVSLEFILILGLGFANQIIVGGLGDTAVAAVGFASSIQYIPFFVLGALGTSASIQVARAYGAKREKELNKVVAAAVITAFLVGVVVAIPFVIWPSQIFTAVGGSEAVVAAGSGYLALAMASLFAGLLAQVLSGVLRSSDHARSPMVATIVTGALQVPLSIVLVYGWGPVPALGVNGAAWAMIIATALRVIMMLVQTYGVARIARWETPGNRLEWKSVLGPLIVLGAPMGLTAGFWSTGNFLYNVVIQRLGDAALAASQIVGNLEGIFFVGSLGLMNAVNALVGRAVGAADGTLARAWATYIKRIGIYTGIAFGVLFAFSSLGLSTMFPKVPELVITYSIAGVLINAVLQPIKVRNALMGASVLPSGNDVRGVMIGDFTAPFIVGLPLSIALGLFTPLGIYGVFIGRGIEEIAKVAIFTWRGRRLNWDAIAEKHNMLNPLGDDPAEGLIQK
jgi:putative MATE family efflux protein